MRRSLTLALSVCLLAFGSVPAGAQAVTLVTPQGQPVGGSWQRWANAAEVPTVRGALVFTTNPSDCGGGPTADGCSGEAWTMASSRYALYYELGHQFDWHVLTSGDRQRLARIWGVPHARWKDTNWSLTNYVEDGLEVDFAAVYADCAEGGRGSDGLQSGLAPAIRLDPEKRTCAMVSRASLGQRIGDVIKDN